MWPESALTFFPDLARARVRDGAELLVVLANHSRVGDAQYARTAAAMATFRAIEQRREWSPSPHGGRRV